MMGLHFRILSALTGISFLLFTTAVQADGYYVGIAGGQAELESNHISAGKGATINNKSSAGYIFFGREIDDNIAVEGFFANLGEAKLLGKPGATFKSEGEDYVFNNSTTFTATAKSVGIAGKYHFDIHEGTRLSAKLGVHSWKIEGKVSSAVDKIDLKDDGVDVMSGLGIEYAATDQVASWLAWTVSASMETPHSSPMSA
jgi:hypothetical protein